jgi:hypothetical protein
MRSGDELRTAPSVLISGAALGGYFFALRTVGDLPEQAAIHFDANGVADGWMNRDRYGDLLLQLLVGLPTLPVWLMAGLPHIIPTSRTPPDAAENGRC